jgi:hypothetical protein
VEVRLGSDERHVEAALGQVVEREDRLDAGDASADDDDAGVGDVGGCGHVTILVAGGRRAIGGSSPIGSVVHRRGSVRATVVPPPS